MMLRHLTSLAGATRHLYVPLHGMQPLNPSFTAQTQRSYINYITYSVANRGALYRLRSRGVSPRTTLLQ